jgi:hypothetical protein
MRTVTRMWALSLLIAAPLAIGPAPAAFAQTPTTSAPRDEIGELIRKHLAAPGDEDEPDTVGVKRTAPEADTDVLPNGPAPKVYTPAPRSEPAAPVNINELGKTPDRPPTVRDLAYDARIRSSFASAESFQGPLEGGWTLAEQRDGDHYALQIVDRRDRLEAVWRDVRRPGAPGASGLVDDIQRTGGGLTLRFTVPGEVASVVTLHQSGDGRWAGNLVRGDELFTVTLRRTGP